MQFNNKKTMYKLRKIEVNRPLVGNLNFHLADLVYIGMNPGKKKKGYITLSWYKIEFEIVS